jgi:hypothetical protein
VTLFLIAERKVEVGEDTRRRRPWRERQAEEEGAIRLRRGRIAASAHLACLLIGVVLVAIGLAGASGILGSGPVFAAGSLASGVALLRWVAGGGRPTGTPGPVEPRP